MAAGDQLFHPEYLIAAGLKEVLGVAAGDRILIVNSSIALYPAEKLRVITGLVILYLNLRA